MSVLENPTSNSGMLSRNYSNQNETTHSFQLFAAGDSGGLERSRKGVSKTRRPLPWPGTAGDDAGGPSYLERGD